MCQLTAPPAVFLAGPLQAPGGWLLIAGFFAFVLWLVPYNYWKYLRQDPSARFRRVGLAVLGGALLLVCTSLVLVVLVVFPSTDALGAWMDSQHAPLFASHCPLSASTALFYAYDRQYYGPLETWRNVAFAFLFVGVSLEAIWLNRFARRPRAEPARQ